MSTCTKNDELLRCSKCGEMKPRECFCRDRRSKSGFARHCKDCHCAHQAKRAAVKSKEHNKVSAALEEVSYEKVCRTCKKLLPISMFAKAIGNADYFSNCCKRCTSKYHRNRKYGVSTEMLDEMLAVETCQMPGCGKKLKEDREKKIDHCHTSGKVRAVLCDRCNRLLGSVEKNLHLIQSMLDYIAKHKADDESE